MLLPHTKLCGICTLLARILPLILDFNRLCILFGRRWYAAVCLCSKSKHMHYIIALPILAAITALFVIGLIREDKKNNQ